MKNEKPERDILSIEILYDDKEDLNELVESEDFNKLLLNEAITSIQDALEKGEDKALVAYLSNLECKVLLDKEYFPPIIDKAIAFYEQEEDYVKCGELVKIKQQVNEPKEGNQTSP